MERPKRRLSRRRILLALYASALLLRLLYLADARSNPFLDALGLDARYYDLRAREILEEGLVGDEAYFMGPLYPHLLALVYGAAGRNLDLVRVLQALIAAFVPVLIYRIGSRLLSPTRAMIAAVAAVFYGPFLFYVGTILYTTLAVTLILWILDRIIRPRGERTGAGLFFTGILFGLAAVGKGNLLFFLPFALAAVALPEKKGGRPDLRAPALLLGGLLVVVGLVTARNRAASGDWVWLTSNGGLNFYIGNGPESSGAYEKPKGLDVDNDPSGKGLLEREVGRSLTPTALSREWSDRAIRWIRENPGAEARLLLRKTVFFFSDVEIPQIESYRFQMRYGGLTRALHIPFGLIAPLALAGIAAFLRRRTWVLVAFLFSYAASIIFFFVLTRYRLPVVPVLLLMSAVTLADAVEAFRRRRYRRLAVLGAWFVPLFLFSNLNFYRISPSTGEAQSHYRLGIIRQSEGDTEGALREYRRSIELDPDYERSRLNLGELLAVTGEREEAERQFREAIRIAPDYAKAYGNLGALLYRTDRREEGRAALERAVALDPEYGRGLLHLAVLALIEGEEDGSSRAKRALEHLAPDDPIRGLAGEFLARLEEVETIARSRKARGLDPFPPPATREAMAAELLRDRRDTAELYDRGARGGDPAALYFRGAALYRAGDLDGARRDFEAALKKAPEMPFLHFAVGVLRHREGRPDLALAEFLEETRLHPGFAPAWKNAALLTARSGDREEARRLAAEYLRRGGEEDPAIRDLMGSS
ncbi:MAG: tetratricopeptide repeat protein [Candidatus Eisenbacteria bacterium]|nr:tetratricopeptide repeat protein [Candidatus Eisenbacteria bacterium]